MAVKRGKDQSQARERLLEAAEALFHQRSYHGLSMQDIADELSMQKGSLYHHMPGGKEELFVEVTRRKLARHRDGLQQAITGAGEALRARLLAVANWMIAHAPLGLLPMMHSDLPALSEEHRLMLDREVYLFLWQPIVKLFREAVEREGLRRIDPNSLAGFFLSLMDGLTFAGHTGRTLYPMEIMAEQAVDLFLTGCLAAKAA